MTKFNLKSEEQIRIMAEGGKKLSWIRNHLISKIKPGIKTIELENLAQKEILKAGGEPSFKTVKGYNWATCVSINDEVVHGIPGERIIQEGDVIGIDIGLLYKGFHTDTAWTVLVKSEKLKVKSETERFLRVGEKTLEEAIRIVKPGGRIGQISQVIEQNIKKAGYSPVKVLTGHGVGRELHEEPPIPQFLQGRIDLTPEILPGMTLAIEVIYNLGTSEVVLKSDGWTIVTEDGKISGTFEKTIAVSQNGVIILTP